MAALEPLQELMKPTMRRHMHLAGAVLTQPEPAWLLDQMADLLTRRLGHSEVPFSEGLNFVSVRTSWNPLPGRQHQHCTKCNCEPGVNSQGLEILADYPDANQQQLSKGEEHCLTAAECMVRPT